MKNLNVKKVLCLAFVAAGIITIPLSAGEIKMQITQLLGGASVSPPILSIDIRDVSSPDYSGVIITMTPGNNDRRPWDVSFNVNKSLTSSDFTIDPSSGIDLIVGGPGVGIRPGVGIDGGYQWFDWQLSPSQWPQNVPFVVRVQGVSASDFIKANESGYYAATDAWDQQYNVYSYVATEVTIVGAPAAATTDPVK